MENKLESAAIIASSLLRDIPKPSTEKIVEVLVQSLDAVDEAISVEKKRTAKRQAEVKGYTLAVRR
jgi:hypothetical protein